MSIICHSIYAIAASVSILYGSYTGKIIANIIRPLVKPFTAIVICFINGYVSGWLITSTILSGLFISNGITSCEASSMSSTNLFDKLDINHDGSITRSEFLREMSKLSIVSMDNEDCGCFHCNGTRYNEAEVCDIYEKSGCDHSEKNNGFCFTTNTKKCNCNNNSPISHICKIPLTHSFVDFITRKNEFCPLINNTSNQKTYQRDFHERSHTQYNSDYNKGWNAAVDHALDFATTAVIVDTATDIFVDALIGKE